MLFDRYSLCIQYKHDVEIILLTSRSWRSKRCKHIDSVYIIKTIWTMLTQSLGIQYKHEVHTILSKSRCWRQFDLTKAYWLGLQPKRFDTIFSSSRCWQCERYKITVKTQIQYNYDIDTILSTLLCLRCKQKGMNLLTILTKFWFTIVIIAMFLTNLTGYKVLAPSVM